MHIFQIKKRQTIFKNKSKVFQSEVMGYRTTPNDVSINMAAAFSRPLLRVALSRLTYSIANRVLIDTQAPKYIEHFRKIFNSLHAKFPDKKPTRKWLTTKKWVWKRLWPKNRWNSHWMCDEYWPKKFIRCLVRHVNKRHFVSKYNKSVDHISNQFIHQIAKMFVPHATHRLFFSPNSNRKCDFSLIFRATQKEVNPNTSTWKFLAKTTLLSSSRSRSTHHCVSWWMRTAIVL